MRRKISIIYFAALVAFSAGAPMARAAQNVPLCFAIAENYNNCMRQNQRPRYWGGGGWGGGYAQHEGYRGYGGYGGYGGGYDGGGWGGGGHGDYYDDDYHQYRRARRYHRAQGQCAVWLAQMQANGCM